MPKTTYLIPCWNNHELSLKAIQSAIKQPDAFVIAIDNASTDSTKSMFKNLEGIRNLKLVSNTENLGWIGAVNQGIKLVPEESEFICLLNNDVELPENFSEKIFPHFEEEVGAVGPVGNNTSGMHDYNLQGYPPHHKVKMLIGYCLVVRKSIVDKIGGLDPIFGWGLSDDLDFSLRIRKIGFDLVIARDCRVFHHGSKGVALKYPNDEDYAADLDKKNKIFIGKWGQEEYDEIVKTEPPYEGTIGIPHLDMIHADFVHSLTNLTTHHKNIMLSYVKGSLVMKARNDIVEGIKGDWVLFIDSDMTFSPDSLKKLLAHDVDIVSGLCFRKVPHYEPTIYRQFPGQMKWESIRDYPKNSFFEVDAVGTAFMLVKKRVFDKMPAPWFEYKKNIGEDLSFCYKAKELGFKVHVDTSVKIGHIATHPINEEFHDSYMSDKTVVMV